MFENVLLVGLGGVGSNLFHPLQRFLSTVEKKPVLTIIDGDTVERSNLARQFFGTNDITMPKAKALHAQLKGSDIDIFNLPVYLDEKNIGCITDGSLVISAVDRHIVNKMIQDHCSTLDNVTYICGTGHLTNGNVLVYARREGIDLLPTITEFHPEIANPTDKHPDDPSCMQTATQGAPQLISTNVMGATVILNVVCSLYRGLPVAADVHYNVDAMKVSPIGPSKTIYQLLVEAKEELAKPKEAPVTETKVVATVTADTTE